MSDRERIAMGFLAVAAMGVFSFLLGAVVAFATPGGWEPWRLGLLVAMIYSGVMLVIVAICTLVLVFDT